MNLKQFKYVLVLSQEGTFSGAAEALNISQPSLSQYVKKIESEIGMPLFDRTGGYVHLTDAGRAYIEAGRKILDAEHRMQAKFNDIRENKRGTITIGTSPFRSVSTMPRVAREFKQKHPGVCLVIREDDTASLMESLEHGECNLCLTMLPVDEQSFAYEKLYDEEIVLAVPAAYAELEAEETAGRKCPAVDIKKVDGESFVFITETQYMQRMLDGLCKKYGIRVNASVSVKSLEAQIEMVKAGLGMAVVSSTMQSFCRDDEVRFYSFKQKMPKREVVAVWRRDCEPTQLECELIATVKELVNGEK